MYYLLSYCVFTAYTLVLQLWFSYSLMAQHLRRFNVLELIIRLSASSGLSLVWYSSYPSPSMADIYVAFKRCDRLFFLNLITWFYLFWNNLCGLNIIISIRRAHYLQQFPKAGKVHEVHEVFEFFGITSWCSVIIIITVYEVIMI